MIQEKKEAITDKIPNRKGQQTQQVEKAVYEMKKKIVYHRKTLYKPHKKTVL